MSTEHAEVQEKFQIRTDLALEAREALTEDGRQTSRHCVGGVGRGRR